MRNVGSKIPNIKPFGYLGRSLCSFKSHERWNDDYVNHSFINNFIK